MHVLPSRFRACTNMERFGLIGMIENKKHMEKDLEIMVKNQILNSLIHGSLDNFFDLIYSIHKPERKPNHTDHQAALEQKSKNTLFLKKVQI